MSIQSVLRVDQEDDQLYVEAIVDGMLLTHRQTHWDPPEYGPAICSTVLKLWPEAQDLDLSCDSDELLTFLELFEPQWKPVDFSDELD